MPIPSESEEAPIKGPSEEDEEARLARIRDYVKLTPGVEVLNFRKARHMIALVGNDPLEEEEHVRYRTAEVTTYPEVLPSPIDPRSRRFALCVAWVSKENQEACASFVRDRLKSCRMFATETAEIELFKEFVVLTVELAPDSIGVQPTSEILSDIRRSVEAWLGTVEPELKVKSPFSRATREYWQQKYGVGLATTWRASGKTYVWRRSRDGRFIHVDAGEFLDKGIPNGDEAA